jgi:signal transduction histidine kinase
LTDNNIRAPGVILVAEDNPSNLSLVREVLESAGHRVRVAKDGQAALASVRAERPDLLLLDVHMPRKDGYEVCTELKADGSYSELPVIFLSGMDEVFNKLRAFEVGGVDYVVKPFKPEELLVRVATQLELSRSRQLIKEDSARLRLALAELESSSKRLLVSEKSAAMASLSSGLAHELNNPVNFIVVGVDALKKDFNELITLASPAKAGTENEEYWRQLMSEIPRLLDGIQMGAERTSRIVKNLRSFQCYVQPVFKNADLAEMANWAISLAQEKMPSTIPIEMVCDTGLCLDCYPDKISELIFHVLINAMEAAASSVDPRVKITITGIEEESKPWVIVTISDSGSGLPVALHNRIFDHFFTTKEIGQGAGLGLSIAMHIAQQHGGSIELLPSIEHGATFRISLPQNR